MLQVYGKRKMGELVIIEPNGKRSKVNIYAANCICAFMYEWQEDGKNMWQPWGMLDDKRHIRNLLRDKYDMFPEAKKVRLNMYYDECKDILNYFVKLGHKVECYYKQPKEKGTKK